jgi:hypothetical protein
MTIEFSDWARDILGRSQAAARRFNPDAKIRLARTPSGVEAMLTDRPAPDDATVEIGDMTLYVQSGLEGLVDVVEPHDRLVLRPAGSPPNERGEH